MRLAVIFIFCVASFNNALALIDGIQTHGIPAIGLIMKSNGKGLSGTLIAPNLVLTAAHGLSSDDALMTYPQHKGSHPDYSHYSGEVSAGSIRFEITSEDGSKTYTYNAIKTHSFTQVQNFEYDVGVIVLDRSVPHEIATPLSITSNHHSGPFKVFGHGADGWIYSGGKLVPNKYRTFDDGSPAFRGKQYLEIPSIEDYWQMSPGDSGGPLLNTDGEIFAVNAASIKQTLAHRIENMQKGISVIRLGYIRNVLDQLQQVIKQETPSSKFSLKCQALLK